MTIQSLSVNDVGRVTGFTSSSNPYRKRLLSMGITPGTIFTITRYAPMGDPIQINIRGYSLTLRKDESNIIEVEKIS